MRPVVGVLRIVERPNRRSWLVLFVSCCAWYSVRPAISAPASDVDAVRHGPYYRARESMVMGDNPRVSGLFKVGHRTWDSPMPAFSTSRSNHGQQWSEATPARGRGNTSGAYYDNSKQRQQRPVTRRRVMQHQLELASSTGEQMTERASVVNIINPPSNNKCPNGYQIDFNGNCVPVFNFGGR